MCSSSGLYTGQYIGVAVFAHAQTFARYRKSDSYSMHSTVDADWQKCFLLRLVDVCTIAIMFLFIYSKVIVIRIPTY